MSDQTITCETLLTYLSDYIDNQLDETMTAIAEEHLATCQHCRVMLDSTQKSIILLRQQQQQVVIPQERAESLYQQLSDVFAGKSDENEN